MNKTIEEIVNNDKCCGCFLCYNFCKFNAINMIQSKKGFYIPQVNMEKCINCGECLKKCTINNVQKHIVIDKNYISIYAGKSTDENIRKKSSSGGVFAEIAKYILRNQGVVFGASFNNNYILEHVFINKKENLSSLLGSKYIQSYIGKSYSQVDKLLKEHKKVLFVGTPCQISAIDNYIEDKENLVTIDLVCHGVPSLKIFRSYIHYYFKLQNIESISFRDKSKEGWKDYSIKIQSERLNYIKSHKKDLFFYGYLKNFYLNHMCYRCPFSNLPRIGDITLGDFWGVPTSLDDNLGTSVIIANSLKGNNLLKNIERESKIVIKQIAFKDAIKQNRRIKNGNLFIPREREEIFKNIDLLNFQELAHKYFEFPSEDKIKEVLNKLQNKDIIIFGTGNIAINIINKFSYLKIKYFLDNDNKKWGRVLEGINIFEPNKIINEKKEKIFIVVASSYYNEIKEQLINFGFEENVNFIDGNNYLL